MDLSLWDPPENQDESSNPTNWQHNLYFDPRLDVIEEDALNEKSCRQVLKILIKKADSEIVELEDEILMLQRQLDCEDHIGFAELNEKIANLDGMLRVLKNENQKPAEPGVGSSNLPEDLNNTEAIDDHTSKDIKTVKFKDGCTAHANNTVLASLAQVRYQQETPAETTLEDRHVSEQETKGLKAVQNNDSSRMKGQEVLYTETDCTIEDARPRLLNSKRKERSKRGGDDYGNKTIMETQQLAGAKRAGDFADISTTSQSHSRKRSETSFCEPVIQENNDQRDVQNMLVKSHSRTSQEPQIISSVHNEEVVSPMSSITPAPRKLCIDNMTVVQLRALANQHNIYGVSVTRKADLQQLLRSKLPPEYWS